MPEGASAGELILEPCEYASENGSYAADCGTLVVPETRADPESRLIALPVTRIRARSDDPKEPVFFLTGGPGQSNMEFEFANRYAEDRDFVLVGYRGIDGSVRLDCPEVESALKRSTDVLSEEFFRAYGDGHRACADRLTDDGVDLASYGLVQQIDDLETARVALGYDRINLLSESAGTRTAMIYAWRYPESIHRSVMVAVNPPGNFLLDADTTDEQIGRYAALCADDDSCRTRTDDLAATMRRTAADIPDRWLFLPIKDGNVRVIAMFGLLDSTAAASPTPGPMTLDAWLSAAEGDASGFWFTSILGDLLVPELFVRGQYAAAAMLDAQAARAYFAAGPGTFPTWPCRNGLHLGWWRTGRRLAGRARRGHLQPGTDLAGGDAPHRRGPRPHDAAAGRDDAAPAVPAQRPPGRAAGVRPPAHRLQGAAGSRQPADQHLLRQRPGRRLALRACQPRLHAPADLRSDSRRSPSARCSRWPP